MAKVNILSSGTFRNTLIRYSMMAAMALSALGIYNGTGHFVKESELSRRANAIEQRISSGNLEEVAKTLEFGKENFLRANDYARLATDLEVAKSRKQSLDGFEKAISKGDIEGARAKIDELKAKGVSSEGIVALEKRVYETTEEGLILKMKSLGLSERPNVAEQYIQKYPNGKQRKEVVQTVLLGYMQQVLSELDGGRDLSSLNSKIAKLGLVLDANANEGIYLGDLFSQTSLVDKARAAASNSFSNTKIELTKDREVVFLRKSESFNWVEKYARDREKTIPCGSPGKVIDIIDRDGIFYVVKFPGIKQYSWSKEWSPDKNYWNNDEKNAAIFRREEIGVPFKMSEMERNLLVRDLKILEVKLAPYFVTQGQNSSQMPGKIITESVGGQNAR